MTLADVLAVAAGLAIAGAGFASLSVILSVLAPRAVARARDQAERRPGRSIFLGLAAAVATALTVGAFLEAPAPPLHAGAVLALLAALALAVLGGAGLAGALGVRATEGSGPRPVSVRDLLRGALLLESASLLPLVGWFVVLPAALLLSFGAGVATLLVAVREGARRAPALARS
jgi:hypothetical protein